MSIRPDGTYLLVGAFGSLGLRLQRWFADQGAQSLLLLGRQLPQPGTEAARNLNALRQQGMQVQALTWEMLPQALRTLPEHLPLKGLIHAAGTLRDQRTEAIDPQSLQLVLDSKWGVAERLAVLQKQEPQPWEELDFEVIFSSIAAGLGSPGQLVYGAANVVPWRRLPEWFCCCPRAPGDSVGALGRFWNGRRSGASL